MLQRWGIMLQVVDANAGGGALCCRGGANMFQVVGALCFKWWGALCFKWWMRMWEVGHYALVVDANGSIMPHL